MAAVNSLLARADHLRAQGQVERANAIYAELRAAAEPPHVRAATFRGQVLCAGSRQAELLAAALTGDELEEQAVAVQLVRDLPDAGLTSVFASFLPRLEPLAQAAVLQALRQRNDPIAADAVAALTRSNDSRPAHTASLGNSRVSPRARSTGGRQRRFRHDNDIAPTGPGRASLTARQPRHGNRELTAPQRGQRPGLRMDRCAESGWEAENRRTSLRKGR